MRYCRRAARRATSITARPPAATSAPPARTSGTGSIVDPVAASAGLSSEAGVPGTEDRAGDGGDAHTAVAGGYDSGTVNSGLTRMTAVIGPRVHAKLPDVWTQAPPTNSYPGQPVALPDASTEAPGQSTVPLSRLLLSSVPR